jgi:undecaprenyl-diphosphatase
LDQQLVVVLHQLASSQRTVTALTVLVAERGVILLPVAVAALWLWPGSNRLGRRRAALAAALALGLALFLVAVLAPLFERPRPFVALGLAPLFPHDADSSFPSDHTLLGLALAAAVLWRWPPVGAWLVGWALLIGVARVAAAVHYPSDVIGSAALALLPAAGAQALLPLLEARLLRWLVEEGPL